MADGTHTHLRAGDGSPTPVAVGELYEDCAYEPMLCVMADDGADELVGISLINGRIGSCSPTHCGVRKLSLAEAIEIRGTWPPDHLLEWARSQGIALRLSAETVPPDQVQPGQAGMPADQLQLILERVRQGH